jgi:hypothetical protein
VLHPAERNIHGKDGKVRLRRCCRVRKPQRWRAAYRARRSWHGAHAIDHGASLPEVQATLGYGNIATTSLSARPQGSSAGCAWIR